MRRIVPALLAAMLLAAATMAVIALLRRTARVTVSIVGAPESETEGALVAPLAESVRAAGPWAHASVALGVACVAAAAAGVFASWPRALVRGLGHAACVAALAGAAARFREAMQTIGALGAAATPADKADSIDAALACLVVGLVAEAVALGCAGALRLRRAGPPGPLAT